MRKRRTVLRRYGLNEEQFAAMVKAQHGVCAICSRPPQKRKGTAILHVDHDHQTGKVRGLLCYECNWAMGKFNDSPALLFKAATYLAASIS